ncbi:MAG: hypothetical protein ACO3RV_06530, partial [Luteolibacter sp.]
RLISGCQSVCLAGLRQASQLSGQEAAAALAGMNRMLRAIGITLPETVDDCIAIPHEIRSLAESRWQSRQEKNWSESDRIRDELKSLGWQVKDGKESYHLSPIDSDPSLEIRS